MNRRCGRALLAWGVAGMMSSELAQAQTPETPPAAQEADSGIGDIVVTARRREETSIAVPVVVTAVGALELQRRGVVNLDGIARIVPQLIIGDNNGSIQGGNIVIRGISGPDANPFGDQAASFNIDGVQVAKASVRRLSETDVDVVEVLKGPQALFFGKNSPAGIISIRSADPGDHFEAKGTVGYEFYGREKRASGYVSEPLSDTVGVRLAGYFSDLDGYFKNDAPRGDPFSDNNSRAPQSRDYAIRGTIKYTPSESFNARLKISYAHTSNSSFGASVQRIACPYGAPQSPIVDACKADNRIVVPSSGPLLQNFDSRFGDGQGYLRSKMILAGLEMNYKPSEGLTLTSITGLFYNKALNARNAESDYITILPSTSPDMDRELSQEIRLTSDYESPVNFTIGAYFSDTHASSGSHTFLYGADARSPSYGFGCTPETPCQINNYFLKQDGRAWSAYLQLSYKPVESIEITAGGRYSHESKKLPLVKDGTGIGTPGPLGFAVANVLDDSTIIHPLVEKDQWNDFSPEVTASWRPNGNLTVFASYKHGFLSGGFNSGATSLAGDLSYDPQTIKGFEGGVKALLFDNRLRVNVAAYRYSVKDLQVTNFINATGSIRNAGAVRIKGVEMDFAYRAPVEGLTLRGAAAYNNARYTSFPGAPCYNGQTTTAGCIAGPNAPIQDLGGTELIRAPKWNLSAGTNFERPVGDFKLGLSVDATYSSSFLTDATSSPYGRQPKYAMLDGSVRFGDANDVWQVSLIGRNLTNRHVYFGTYDVPFTGTTATGLAADDAGQRLADRYGVIGRGRELMLQFSYKFAK